MAHLRIARGSELLIRPWAETASSRQFQKGHYQLHRPCHGVFDSGHYSQGSLCHQQLCAPSVYFLNIKYWSILAKFPICMPSMTSQCRGKPVYRSSPLVMVLPTKKKSRPKYTSWQSVSKILGRSGMPCLQIFVFNAWSHCLFKTWRLLERHLEGAFVM